MWYIWFLFYRIMPKWEDPGFASSSQNIHNLQSLPFLWRHTLQVLLQNKNCYFNQDIIYEVNLRKCEMGILSWILLNILESLVWFACFVSFNSYELLTFSRIWIFVLIQGIWNIYGYSYCSVLICFILFLLSFLQTYRDFIEIIK